MLRYWSFLPWEILYHGYKNVTELPTFRRLLLTTMTLMSENLHNKHTKSSRFNALQQCSLIHAAQIPTIQISLRSLYSLSNIEPLYPWTLNLNMEKLFKQEISVKCQEQTCLSDIFQVRQTLNTYLLYRVSQRSRTGVNCFMVGRRPISSSNHQIPTLWESVTKRLYFSMRRLFNIWYAVWLG